MRVMAERRDGVCPDCPAARVDMLEALIEPPSGRCALRCVCLSARQPMPPRWFGMYGLALVRRGVIVRQRVDAHGCATAIDAIGPGGAAPLSDSGEADTTGYAAADALICLCPKAPLRASIDAGAPTASQMVALQAAALERVERIAAARGRPTAIGRLAALVCALADTLSPPRRLTVVPGALQQRDLGALLGMRHESVCRALGSLEDSGALVRTHDGIRLLDRAKLEATEAASFSLLGPGAG
jgi:CRP-like cAMP-binding protein